MRREKRRRIEGAHELTITSMVDMFTLLLTFLLNFVSPTDPGADGLLLPDSTSAAQVGEGVTMVVSKGEVRVGDQRVGTVEGEGSAARLVGDAAGTLDGLTETLRTARSSVAPTARGDAGDKGAILLVQCDRSLPYALVAQLLGAANEAGFERFRLVVEGNSG